MRALLKPPIGKAHVDELPVTMIARVSRGLIKVEGNRGSFRAVDSFRLYSEHDRHRRITAEEFARLPWQGKGVDPLTQSTQELFDALEVRP